MLPIPQTLQDGQPLGGVGRKQAVKGAQWQLGRLVAVTQGDARRPRICRVDPNIHDLLKEQGGKQLIFATSLLIFQT